jgi:hypothetical protein
MIDNPKQVTTLMQKLKSHLPIPAKATDALIRNLRTNSIIISSNTGIEILNVMYMGDEGGHLLCPNGYRSRRSRCCGVNNQSPFTNYTPAFTRCSCLPNLTNEEIGQNSLRINFPGGWCFLLSPLQFLA